MHSFSNHLLTTHLVSSYYGYCSSHNEAERENKKGGGEGKGGRKGERERLRLREGGKKEERVSGTEGERGK